MFIVPAYTFIASYSSVIISGHVPVLAEIDDSLCLDRTMAVVKAHGLHVIEDICQANGASYKGRKRGSFGEAGVFSLNFFKTLTAGDGGRAVARSGPRFLNKCPWGLTEPILSL